MNIQFYNTLTNRLQPFEPLEPGIVTIYSCGPTVYDYAHIGNFRTFLFGDLLRRFLELAGYEVRQVMNITDVGHMTDDQVADGAGLDKMEQASKRIKENKKAGTGEGLVDPNDPFQIARFYSDAFLEDARRLGYKIAFEPDRIPRATEHIEGMQRLIQRLLDRGHAYQARDGVVYFSVESFPRYGQLSGNSLDRLHGGAGGRVSEENQAMKRHPADFMLWKPDPHHLMKWPSPWGAGYPGWHIECSVMAMQLLGSDVIDIHTGGEDLIFPHHECEIAQSCGATGRQYFARFWIHARFLFVEDEKMSKSKGNFFTARDVLEGKVTGRPVDPAVLRYELIKSHYRDNLNFTRKGLIDSARNVRRLQELRATLQQAAGEPEPVDRDHPVLQEFAEALADDLNISKALAVVWKWAGGGHDNPARSLGVLQQINSVLSVAPINEEQGFDVPADSSAGELSHEAAERLGQQIDQARAAKDYTTADEIRKKLNDAGFEVRTTKEGTTIQKLLV